MASLRTVVNNVRNTLRRDAAFRKANRNKGYSSNAQASIVVASCSSAHDGVVRARSSNFGGIGPASGGAGMHSAICCIARNARSSFKGTEELPALPRLACSVCSVMRWGSSAADLKFLHGLRQTHFRNFKSALRRIICLLVPLLLPKFVSESTAMYH